MSQRYSLRRIIKSLKIKSLRLVTLLIVFGLLSGNGAGLFPKVAQASSPASGSDNEIIVQLLPGTNISLLTNLLGLNLVRALSLDQTYVLSVPLGLPLNYILSLLNLNPLVVFAEPNYKMFATEAQQAFLYYDQGSGLQNGGTDPQAAETAKDQWAWGRIALERSQNLSEGAGVTVAILDTGVNKNHPAIKDQLVPGYNVTTMNDNVNDDSGHGTFVAGVVAQVAPDASIMPVKVLNSQGEGTVADASEGMFWAANHNAQVINMSLGLYSPSKLLELTVKYAQARGELVIASAGNSGTADKRYPAAYPGVIGVAATDSKNHKASFSNYGPNARISAPGVQIYSAYYTGGYAYGDGTSFAAPQIAGLAAQVWSENSNSPANFVSNRILNTAVSLQRDEPTYASMLGSGLVNNYKAVLNQ